MNTSDIDEQLARLETQYKEWQEPINAVIQQSLPKVNRNGYTFSDFQRDVKEATEKQRAKYDLMQEIHNYIDKLCPAYLDANEQQRAQIRRSVEDKEGIQANLLGYANRSADRIVSVEDTHWLRKGLAAISIENCARDFRDVLLALSELYVKAERAGINPQSHFEYVAEISSREKPSGGSESVSAMLRDFHGYAVLKERRRREE